jgi:hypothetical protein
LRTDSNAPTPADKQDAAMPLLNVVENCKDINTGVHI